MRPIKLSKKELGLTVIAVCLALASLAPTDRYVFISMLVLSFAACLYVAYHHEGRPLRRAIVVIVIAGILVFIGYRNELNWRSSSRGETRIDVTNVVPVLAHSNKGNGLFVNVFYANHGKLHIKRMVHRCVSLYSEDPLNQTAEDALVATADSLPFPNDLPPRVEIPPGDSPKHYFSCEQSDEQIMNSWKAADVLTSDHRLYIAVVLKYQDDSTPRDKVIVTEFCGWFGRTFEMWHNCGRNRLFSEAIK